MKPIENPFDGCSWMNERSNKMQQEIDAFMACGAQYAEMWMDETITIGRSMEIYKTLARRARLSNSIKFRQKQKRIIACRLPEGKQ